MQTEPVEIKLSKLEDRKILLEYVAPVGQLSALKTTHLQCLHDHNVPKAWFEAGNDNGIIINVRESYSIEFTNGCYRIGDPAGNDEALIRIIPMGAQVDVLGSSGTTSIFELGARYGYHYWFDLISSPPSVKKSRQVRHVK